MCPRGSVTPRRYVYLTLYNPCKDKQLSAPIIKSDNDNDTGVLAMLRYYDSIQLANVIKKMKCHCLEYDKYIALT